MIMYIALQVALCLTCFLSLRKGYIFASKDCQLRGKQWFLYAMMLFVGGAFAGLGIWIFEGSTSIVLSHHPLDRFALVIGSIVLLIWAFTMLGCWFVGGLAYCLQMEYTGGWCAHALRNAA